MCIFIVKWFSIHYRMFKDSVKKTKIPVEQSVRWGEETLRRRKTALVHWS